MIVLAGPTAVGKTAIAIRLARDISSEIISCDSRQFYLEMNIGTAKPAPEQLAEVKHHFINNLSIKEYYSAGRFEEDVIRFLDSYFKQHNHVIMVGGSGFYMNAVCEGISHMPPPDAQIRQQLLKELKMSNMSHLYDELSEKDPEYFMIADKRNPKRILRALEVIRQTGFKYSELRNQVKKKRNFRILKIGLDTDRKELYDRINRRMDEMISNGLFEEAGSLYPQKNLNALQTVGYQEIFDHLDGLYDREETIRLLKRNSRRYAKRQITWFKKDPSITWFHPDQYNEILKRVLTFLKAG